MKVGDLRVFKRYVQLPCNGEFLCNKPFVVTHIDRSRDAVRIMIIDSGHIDYWDKTHLIYCSKTVAVKKCP